MEVYSGYKGSYMIGRTLPVSCRCVLRCCVVKEHQIETEIHSRHDIFDKITKSAHKLAEIEVVEGADSIYDCSE